MTAQPPTPDNPYGTAPPAELWDEGYEAGRAAGAAAERERCARIVEADAEQFIRTGYPVQEQLRKRAAAIRSLAPAEKEGT